MEIIIGLVLIVLIIVGICLALYLNKEKHLKAIKEKLRAVGEIKEVKANAFDLILTVNNQQVFVKILLLGIHKELSINSRRHWQVDASTKKLKLLKTGGFEKIKGTKILLVSPPVSSIVKYINENEVVFVKCDELCFDFYLFTTDEIDKIKEVII